MHPSNLQPGDAAAAPPTRTTIGGEADNHPLWQIAVAAADSPPGIPEQPCRHHPSSPHLAVLHATLQARFEVTVSRALTPTEALESVEDLGRVMLALWEVAHLSWGRDHRLTAAVQAAEQASRRLTKTLLAAHGDYDCRNDTFPTTIALGDAVECAGGGAEDTGAIGGPLAAEVAGWLALVLHLCLRTLVALIRQEHHRRHPDRWWRAAITTTEAYLRLIRAATP